MDLNCVSTFLPRVKRLHKISLHLATSTAAYPREADANSLSELRRKSWLVLSLSLPRAVVSFYLSSEKIDNSNFSPRNPLNKRFRKVSRM